MWQPKSPSAPFPKSWQSRNVGAGQPAQLHSSRDRFLGYVHVNPHSLIAARIVGREAAHPPGIPLLVHRLKIALALREKLYAKPFYRLAFGESDSTPCRNRAA